MLMKIRRTKKMKLYKTINVYIDDGIFSLLQPKFDWMSVEDAKTLDLDYYLNHGQRSISPLYEQLINQQSINDNFNALNKLVDIIYLKFKDKWNRIYDSYIKSTYNALENYSMVEVEKTNTKVTSTDNTKGGSYGFNSDVSVPVNDSNSTSVVEGKGEDNKRELTRSGNIGVTSSQQMLEQELQLRKYNFYEELFKDVNSVVTLSIYCDSDL